VDNKINKQKIPHRQSSSKI